MWQYIQHLWCCMMSSIVGWFKLIIPPWWQSLATHRFPHYNSKIQSTNLWSTNSQGGNLNLHVATISWRKAPQPASKSPPSSCRTCKRSCQAFPPKCPQWKFQKASVFIGEKWGGKGRVTSQWWVLPDQQKKIRHYNVHLTHYTPPRSLMDASCKISERSEVFQHLE